MALVTANRVKETTTVTTGTATLLGAATGFQSFAVIGNSNTTYYCIAGQTTSEWEVGIGTYASSGTTLARTTILANSSATQPTELTFSAGTKDVFVTYPSSKGVYLDASGNAIGLGTPAAFVATNVTGLPISSGVSGLGTGVATALAVNVGTAGAPVVNGGALGTPASGTVTNLTGTASININGTVGATTPAAGSFTTVSATGATTVAAGTALLPAIVSTTGTADTGLWFPAADTVAASTAGTERLRIDSSGNVCIGQTATYIISGVTPSVQLGKPSSTAAYGAFRWGTPGGGGALFMGASSRGAEGVYTAVASGDGLSSFYGSGADGTSLIAGGAIQITCDGAVSTSIVPGRIQFFTANTSGTNTERMRIDSSGNLLVGTATSPAGSKELVLGGDYIEGVVVIGTVGASNTISLANGTFQTATLTASTPCTFTMPTATAGKSFILILTQAASGMTTATFTSVKFPGGTAPTITATASAVDILTFVANGTSWFGTYAQAFA